jgi:hypothetical protein
MNVFFSKSISVLPLLGLFLLSSCTSQFEPLEVNKISPPIIKNVDVAPRLFAAGRPEAGGGVGTKYGIFYLVWHCLATDNIYDISKGQIGPTPTFHWWSQPAAGYYCLSRDRQVLRDHAVQLRDAGIDFIYLDFTNFNSAAQIAGIEPLKALLEEWSKIPGAPRVVPWLPLTVGSPFPAAVDQILSSYPTMLFKYQGRPLMLAVAMADKPIDQAMYNTYASRYTMRKMGAQLFPGEDPTIWSFMQPCQAGFRESGGTIACNQRVAKDSSGNVEQVSVTAAYQETIMSDTTTAVPKFFGRTLKAQMKRIDDFDSPPIVTITGWNEWIVQRLCIKNGMPTGDCSGASETLPNGNYVFVDSFNDEYNRDLEPGGAHGDFYYRLMKSEVASRKARSIVFDPQWYLQAYSDLRAGFGTDTEAATQHWLNYGINEGRQGSPLFSAQQYLSMNPDLQAAFGANNYSTAIQHFISDGHNEGRVGMYSLRSEVFNPWWYLSQYGDVSAAVGTDPVEASRHWLGNGIYEGRQGSPQFSASHYLARYIDLQNAYGATNYQMAILHYVLYGINEGRNGQ